MKRDECLKVLVRYRTNAIVVAVYHAAQGPYLPILLVERAGLGYVPQRAFAIYPANPCAVPDIAEMPLLAAVA